MTAIPRKLSRRRERARAEDQQIEQLTGHIHLRPVQMTLWGIVAGLIGAGFIAGLYFGITQCNWHVFYLKNDWDSLLPYKWWPVYRHTAFRDIPEPAFATMGVMTLLAKRSYWDKRVSTLRLVTAPLAVAVITFGLAILGTWLLNYAFGHPVLQWHAAGNLALGFVIGRLVHFYWAPVGATLQGQLLDGPAERAVRRRRIPSWVHLPVVPVQVRERFAKMYLDVRAPDVETPEAVSGVRKWLIVAGVMVFTLVTILGLLGHYWAGAGHTIPWIMAAHS